MFSIGQYCCPNWWSERAHPSHPSPPQAGEGIGGGKDARGPAAEGEGASGGGTKQPMAGSGTKVASKMIGSPAGATSSFLSRLDE
jgi:hypothetical protein